MKCYLVVALVFAFVSASISHKRTGDITVAEIAGAAFLGIAWPVVTAAKILEDVQETGAAEEQSQ